MGFISLQWELSEFICMYFYAYKGFGGLGDSLCSVLFALPLWKPLTRSIGNDHFAILFFSLSIVLNPEYFLHLKYIGWSQKTPENRSVSIIL